MIGNGSRSPGCRPVARPYRRRRRPSFRPSIQALEPRIALALDLATVDRAPLGVLEAGDVQGGGAGSAVAEVGDVNGDGFDDFVIGAPDPNGSLVGVNDPNFGSFSRAYLVFGSRQDAGPLDYLRLNTQQRVGDQAFLGNRFQTNPKNNFPGFAFDGLRFWTSRNPEAGLGASVAAVGDINRDGFADFLIGAPGARDASGSNPGTGRAYLVFGGPTLAAITSTSQLVDLDNPQAYPGLRVVTFVSSVPGARLGRGVGLAGDVLTDGLPDVVVGAPGASGGFGAAYLIDGASLPALAARSATVDLARLGRVAGGARGVTFVGTFPGEQVGFSVGSAGNFDGRVQGGRPVDALLIGAPARGIGAGSAYLVYGGSP